MLRCNIIRDEEEEKSEKVTNCLRASNTLTGK